MTAIKTKSVSSLSGRASSLKSPLLPLSKTEEEAKSRFVSVLTKGVDTLLERGHGRERASAQLLSEIADGCCPNEDEIFQTMELLGISFEDARKVMTVSSAFRKARTTKGGSAIEAIDELASRLHLANSSNGQGRSRSPSPSPSRASALPTPSNLKLTELSRDDHADSYKACSIKIPGVMSIKGQRFSRAKNNQQGRGRKRTLNEKTSEKRDDNEMIDEPKTKASDVAAADLEVKEKMLNAKLAKTEVKKPNSSARAKSPEGGMGSRGKLPAVAHAEETQSNKRSRTRSQTEESIPAI